MLPARTRASAVDHASQLFDGLESRSRSSTLALVWMHRQAQLGAAGGSGPVLVVRGLDCLDGTPLIDLKPDRCAYTPVASERAK
jgi:hypothetical protein